VPGWRSTFGLVLLALCAAGPALAQSGEKRVALVVGNAHYRNVPPLLNTGNDARLVARTLQGLGFKLVGGGAQLDLDDAGLKKAIAAFGDQAAGSTAAVFYYAGHGLQVQGANFLVPVDANPVKLADVDLQLVDTKIVLDELDDSDARFKMVLLDACRNNPFGGRGLRDLSRGLAEMPVPRGTLISYATQPGNVANDGPSGSDSPYTVALAKAMQQPGLDALEMFNEVGLMVDQATSGAQQPWLASSPIQGKFYFAGKLAPPAVQATGAAPADPDGLLWQSVMASSNPADFQRYLDQYPKGAYAALAQSRIAMLAAPPPAPQAAEGSGTAQQRALEAKVMFPASVQLAKPSGNPTDPFLGEWYGMSNRNGGDARGGREMIFAIQNVYGDSVVALEGLAAILGDPRGPQGAFTMQRTGRYHDKQIDFKEPGLAPLIVKLLSEGELEIDSTTSATRNTAYLHRIAP